MKKIILVLFFYSSHVYAEFSCSSLFSSEPRTEIEIGPSVKSAPHSIILDAFNKTLNLLNGFHDVNLPSKIYFKETDVEIEDLDSPDLGSVDLNTDTITLPGDLVKLSDENLKALIVHEITHLIVAYNFKTEFEDLLVDFLKTEKDSEKRVMTEKPHTRFAELLCDLMGVIITQNPVVYRDLTNEIQSSVPKRILKLMDPLQTNNEFKLRDFSIPYTSKGWSSARISHENDHNYFNQVRSYLWQRWVTKIPQTRHGEFFSTVLKLMGLIYTSGRIDQLIYFEQTVPEINQAVIDFLEIELSKVFRTQ